MDNSPGGARTIFAASGGTVYPFNLSTTPIQVLGNDPQRRRVTFHNPGTIDLYVAPLYVQTGGTDTLLVPSPTALAGCFIIYGSGGTLVLEGEVQKPWQAFSASGTNVPLTVVPARVL